MTTGKTVALTRQTLIDKVMSLLFNMLSRLFITFLPRSKCLLISWLQSPSSVILEPRKIKSATVFTVSPSICHEVMGPDAMILLLEAAQWWMTRWLCHLWRLPSASSLNAAKLDPWTYERLLLNHAKTPGFLAPREEFNLGPETRLDHSKLLCNKVLLKYKGDRENFWHRHQKGAERVPPCWC